MITLYEGSWLECPKCGGNYLHHENVDIYYRKNEDDTDGVHTRITGKTVTVDDDISSTPSRRRDGLTVAFWCEHCDAEPVLAIAQHKGNTHLYWM